MDDEELAELEQTMRAGLERRAERADVLSPVAAHARNSARTARRRRTLLAGLAAASVVTVVATASMVARDDGRSEPSPAAPSRTDSVPSTSMTSAVPSADGFTRTEYYAGLQVDVPADWAWGSTPILCGGAPVDRPYVGRPIAVTDACGQPDPDAVPTAPYVWVGAELPLGTVDLGDGWTRETMGVDGTTLSVATQDDELRYTILGSAASQQLCTPALERAPEPRYETTVEGVGDFVEAKLCAYRDEGDGLTLWYAKKLDEAVDTATFQAADTAPRSSTRCLEPREVVTVDSIHADPYSKQKSLHLQSRLVYNLSCGTLRAQRPQESSIQTRRLTEETVQPWATEEFRHLLIGPSDQWAYRYFIGIQG